jgi:HEPN domain-containing protein
MRSKDDLVASWIRKVESDLANLGLCLENRTALDTACFHAQQAAEKYLKAYLTHHEMDFPYVHNLAQLVGICARSDPEFLNLKDDAQRLTPYAVEPRYGADFRPSLADAQAARGAAFAVKDFVLQRLPSDRYGPARH